MRKTEHTAPDAAGSLKSLKPFSIASSGRTVLAIRGNLSVVLTRLPEDIFAAQRLRYRIFYEELNARPDSGALMMRCDRDDYDRLCDHLLVLDSDTPRSCSNSLAADAVVGTYRLLPQERATGKRFYSEREFDMSSLLARHRGLRFLELGRSCVATTHRTGAVVELLWQGVWNYVRLHRFDVMFGCASFEGSDPKRYRNELSFLADNFAAPEEWRVQAIADRFIDMHIVPRHSYDAKAAARTLPALIKGYLRLGSYIGDGAVIDRQFNTTDILVILPVHRISKRYFSRFEVARDPPVSY